MFCSKCGTQLPDGSAFCGNCGNPVAAPAAPVAPVAPVAEVPAQPVYEAPVAPAPVAPVAVETPAAPVAPAPVYQQPVAPAPVYQQPVAPAPKKKGNATLIAIIAVVAVLAIVAGVLFATGAFDSDSGDKDDDKDTGSSTTTTVDGDGGTTTTVGGDINQPNGGTPVLPPNNNTTTQPPADSVAFSLGTVDGGYYTNRFAGLRLPISSNWVDQGSGQGNIGLYMQSQAEDELVQIMFIDRADSGLTETTYLEQFCDALETQYAELGLTIRFDYPATLTVAGHYGVGVTAVLTAGSDRLYEGIFVYAVDDYLVVLNITTLAEEGVGNIMNSFTAY